MGYKPLSKLKISGSKVRMPQLQIGDSVARVPIIQGGMGVGISLSGLASAVANAGGIGVIAANAIGMLEPDYYQNGREANIRALRREIKTARKRSRGIIGVNIMVAVNDFQEMLRVSIEEKVDMVFLGAGLPLKGMPVEALRRAGVKVAPIVSSARAARLIFQYWKKQYNDVPDAVVVEGPKAGGHLGFKIDQIDDPAYALEHIVPDVVAVIETFEKECDKAIPVIAAGGIFDGEDIFKYFKLGASGVQMATRFVATHECDADKKFKETYVQCKPEDISIIKSPVGLPGRAIRNGFLDEVAAGERKLRCAWRCLESCDAKKARYCISEALNSARQGIMTDGYAFAGSNAYRVEAVVGVKKLVRQLQIDYFKMVRFGTMDLRKEFEEALDNLNDLKDEYLKAVRKNARSMRKEMDDMLVKGTTAVREEYQGALAKLEGLKTEYADHFDKVNELKEQLSKYFDTTSLKLPKAAFG